MCRLDFVVSLEHCLLTSVFYERNLLSPRTSLSDLNELSGGMKPVLTVQPNKLKV